ncbi:MAG: hypothetical protein ACRD1K_01745 [Acidimicrobiales bacterium]
MAPDRETEPEPSEDERDRILIRQLLAMTPLQRLGSLSNFYRFYRVGQQRLGRGGPASGV